MNDQQKKVSQNRLKKEEIVAELSEKIEKAKGMVFTNYQGLTHQQIESFKRALKVQNAEYVNTKNTLLKRALKDKVNTEEEKEKFEQPTATLFMYDDVVAPLKQLSKSIKELSLPTVKFALVDGKMLTEADVNKLSTLPPLPVLQAQLLGMMKTPITGLHRALSWNMQKLVMTLKAVSDKKQATSQTS